LGATVDVLNISKGRFEAAITASGGYDFTGGNFAFTGVLGAKYTLVDNLRLPVISPLLGAGKLRLYGGVGVEGDVKVRDDAPPSGYGGILAGGGFLFELNPFEKKK
jgi:hypothetical protein